MQRIAAFVSALLVAGIWTSAALAQSQKIESASGPLTRIEITTDLNCAVDHIADTQPEFFGDTACGTLVAAGGILYRPDAIPAGSSASPYTAFTPVSQSAVLGSGTRADPYRIVTVVALGLSGLQVTETDSYVVGDEAYRTDVTITNAGTAAANVILYRAGDCYLQDSDDGFGRVDGDAIACRGAVPGSNPPAPGDRIEQWIPLTPGSRYYEAGYSQVWGWIGSQLEFPNTCLCDDYIDNGAGLSWTLVVPAGGSVTASHLTNFSPQGRLALSTGKTADAAQSAAGGENGYTITLTNPNATAVTVNSISDTLPEGFSYRAGSTSGATTADPSVSGRTLTWNGPFTAPASGTLTLHFGVTASLVPGTYYNAATADAQPFTVLATGETAPIEVVAAVADAGLTKTGSPGQVAVGQNVTYTLTATNGGPGSATAVTVTDTLPAGLTFVSASASQGSCAGTQTITCTIGTLASGASATVTIVARATNPGQVTNTGQISADQRDPATTNNSASTTTTVTASADASIVKAASEAVRVGDNITYTLTARNDGPSPASGVTVTDTLPAGVSFVSASASQGSCTGTATITCNVGDLASGASATVTIVARADAPGSVTNTASVGAAEADPSAGNNTASATTTVNPAPLAPPARCQLAVTPRRMVAGKPARLRVVVLRLGTRTPAANARVVVRGPGVRAVGETGRRGGATFRVRPARAGVVTVRVPSLRACTARVRVRAAQPLGALTGRRTA